MYFMDVIFRPIKQSGSGASLALLILWTSVAFAAESSEDTATQEAEPVSSEQGDQNLLEYIQSKEESSARSVRYNRETSVFGAKWGWTVLYDTPLNSQPDGASATLRLAKLHFFKQLGTNWDVRVNVNYNNSGQFELGKNFLEYSGWKATTVTLGIFDPPFSLERISKREGTTFMERALPVESLSERRTGGIGVLTRTADSILSAGLLLAGPDYEGQSESGQALVLHYVHAPLERKKEGSIIGGRRIWAGLSLSYRTNVNESETKFRSHPEIATISDYFVDTGPIIGAEDIIRLGFEISRVSGPFSSQAELLGTRVRRQGMDSVDFSGGYLLASWFLTDDTRHYNPVKGAFLSVDPHSPLGDGGKGALEIATRASYVDLNDRDIVGGEESNLSLGLNWYPTSNWRLMLNLIKVLDVKRPGSIYDGEDPLILSLRAQWYLH